MRSDLVTAEVFTGRKSAWSPSLEPETVKRIPTPDVDLRPRSDAAPRVTASQLVVAIAMAARIEAYPSHLAQVIENELAFARFQGYRQAMDDAEADKAGAPWPPTGFGPAVDRKNA